LELQALIKQRNSELTLLTPRFRTRLSHLRGRLLYLTEFDPSASGITTTKYEQVSDRLHSIEINLAKMDVADRTGQETEEGDDTSNTRQEVVSAQDNSSPDERQGRQDAGILNTVTEAVHVEVGALADQIAQVIARMVAAQITPSGQGIKQVFTQHFSTKILSFVASQTTPHF